MEDFTPTKALNGAKILAHKARTEFQSDSLHVRQIDSKYKCNEHKTLDKNARCALRTLNASFSFFLLLRYWLKTFWKVIILPGRRKQTMMERRKKCLWYKPARNNLFVEKQLQRIFALAMIRLIAGPLLRQTCHFSLCQIECPHHEIFTANAREKNWNIRARKMRNYIILHLIPFRMSFQTAKSCIHSGGL